MAYFPNGTAGDILQKQCDKCLHGMNDSLICPVVQVQLTYNYEQIGNEDLQTALNILVDDAGTCRMRTAMIQAGITIDLSGREQLPLLEG